MSPIYEIFQFFLLKQKTGCLIGGKCKVDVHEKRAATKHHKQYDIAIITLDRRVSTNKLERPICFGDMKVSVKPGDKVSLMNIS